MKNIKIIHLFLHILRFAISGASIYAGWHIVTKKFSEIIEISEISIISSAFLLLIIEVGSVLFISYATYFFYTKEKGKRDRKLSLQLFIIASVFLGVSFFVSANGASALFEKHQDKYTEIKTSFKEQKTSSNAYYSKLISETRAKYDSLANLPTEQYKTARLMQTQKLKTYSTLLLKYQDLQAKSKTEIKITENAELQKNDSEISEISRNYYIIAGVIVLFVFFFNYFAVYLLETKIKQNKDSEITEISVSEILGSEIYEISKSKSEIISDEKLTLTQKILKFKEQKLLQKEIAEILNISQPKITRLLQKHKNNENIIKLNFIE